MSGGLVGALALVLAGPTLRAWFDGALGTETALTRSLAALLGAWVSVWVISRLVGGYSTPDVAEAHDAPVTEMPHHRRHDGVEPDEALQDPSPVVQDMAADLEAASL